MYDGWSGGSHTVLSDRGQAALIGVVLLFGTVAAISFGIFVIGGEALEETEQQAETERVKQAFVELSRTMNSASSSDDTTYSLDLDLSDSGAVVLKNTSTMTIEHGNQTEEIDFGTIEYEGDDGTRIAYQGGGVFSETGNQTRVVSAPPVSYVNDQDSETLSFPIIEPTEEGSISSGKISASKAGTDLKFSEVVENSEVTLEIQGPYYRGWEMYFERQAGESAIDSIDHDNNSVTVLLTQSSLGTLYENGVVTDGNITVDSGAAEINGPVLYGGELNDNHNAIDEEDAENVGDIELKPIDGEVSDKIEEAKRSESDYEDFVDEVERGNSGEVTPGKYYVKDYDYNLNAGNTSDEIVFNISDGDIELVVEDSMNIRGDHTIEGIEDGNGVDVYTNAELESSGNVEICVEKCYTNGGNIDAAHLEIYGASDFALGGNMILEGVIYSPDATIGEAGGQEIYGAIIASNVDISGNLEVTHDPELTGGPDVDSGGGIPEIVYLNIVQHDIEFAD